jgi:iron complex transport system substrate-binding protein
MLAGRLRRALRYGFGMSLAVLAQGAIAQADEPHRIVSLNLCLDELVLRMVEPERIASVTWLSRDPGSSNVADLAARVPVNHGLAEEVIPQDPDLVLAGSYTTRAAVALLQRTGLPVAEYGIPRSVAELRGQIAEIAERVRRPQQGARLIAEIDAGLAAIPPPPARRPTALVFNANGATIGKGTLVDEIISRAGLDNLAARLDIDNYGQVPLETVVANAVDILIVSASRDGPPALATEILRHPVLAKLAGRTRIVVMPGRLWNCGGPAIAEAVARLRAAADALARERSTQ